MKQVHRIAQRLHTVKFYMVEQLHSVYRCVHAPSAHLQVANKTCWDTTTTKTPDDAWTYFVRADAVANESELIRGFCKLFALLGTRGGGGGTSHAPAVERELVKFSLMMHQLSKWRLSDDDRRQIEADFECKLSLPSGECEWNMPSHDPASSSSSPADSTASPPASSTQQTKRHVNATADTSNYNKPIKSKAQTYMEYERLSRAQINDPSQVVATNNVLGREGEDRRKNNAGTAGAHKLTNEFDLCLRTLASNGANFNVAHLDERQQVIGDDEHTSKTLDQVSMSTLVAADDAEQETLGISARDLQWHESVLTHLNGMGLATLVDVNNDQERSGGGESTRLKIGRWGEMWVHEMMKRRYESEIADGSLCVEWVNERAETGLPFDFRLTRRRLQQQPQQREEGEHDDDEEEETTFIEVKSTRRAHQEVFPVSSRELAFAHECGANYHIYRLYNVGQVHDVRLKIVKNLPRLLNTHQVNLFMLI